jgi:hypothetical protein
MRMKLPILNEITSTREVIDVFKGYNNNLRIGEGEFHDMKNLTSDDYPVLSPRKSRGIFQYDDGTFPINPQGLIAKDTLCYVDCITEEHAEGARFYINKKEVEGFTLSSKAQDCPKQLISMGAYVIIMPDKKWIKITTNIKDDSGYEYGDIEASVTTNTTVNFEMCKIDGSSYGDASKGSEAPDNPSDGELWIDTSSKPHTLKQYSESNAMWVSIATTYVKISATGIGLPFAVNDGVTISGIESEHLSDLNNTMIIWAKDERKNDEGNEVSDWIVVTGILDEIISQTNPITIERKMPNMDFVIESENRLWGCRYGVANNGEVVNEIYASKLGDFKNWNCFMGLSTDSYAVTVGTDGQFTGAIAHLGYPIFFKENCMHKVYGNYPANYQITTTTCRGVQKGSHKSLAIVNEILYYKSRASVCVYDGSLPQEISYNLGNVDYSNAVACSHGNKYYISMHNDSSNTWNLFVYDTALGLWHKDDKTKVYDFCSCRGELYFIDHTDEGTVRIKTMFGSGVLEAAKIKWMAETGLIGTDAPDQKYISKLNVRMYAEMNSIVFVYIQYDSTNDWELVYRMAGMKLQSFTIPIRPRRCDHLKLRFEGEGVAKIYSIAKTIEQGSDVL